MGEKVVEGGLKFGAVVRELVGGGGEFDGVAAGVEAVGDAGEGEADAVEGRVGGEPIVGDHGMDGGVDGEVSVLGEEGEVGVESGVGVGDEFRERLRGVVGPVCGEEVIEEDVDEDGGVAVPVFREEGGTVGGEWVGVGEGVDVAVESEAGLDVVGE